MLCRAYVIFELISDLSARGRLRRKNFDIAHVGEIGWAQFLACGVECGSIPMYEDPFPSYETPEVIKSRMETTKPTSNLRELRLYIYND